MNAEDILKELLGSTKKQKTKASNEDLNTIVESYTNELIGEILANHKKNLPKRIVERKAKGDTVYTSKTAKEIMDLLPTFQLSEKLGETGAADRATYEKYFDNIIKSGTNARERISYVQGIVSGEAQDITGMTEILSSLTFVKLLSDILASFNPASAGFVFEAWMAALTLGEQITEKEEGTLPIVDYYTSDGLPISLKLLKSSGAIKGSVYNLLRHVSRPENKDVGVVYEIAYKFSEQTLGFYRYNLDYKNVLYRANIINFKEGSSKFFNMDRLSGLVDSYVSQNMLMEAKEEDPFLEYKNLVKDIILSYGNIDDSLKLNPQQDDIQLTKSNKSKYNYFYIDWPTVTKLTSKKAEAQLIENSNAIAEAWNRVVDIVGLNKPGLSNEKMIDVVNSRDRELIQEFFRQRQAALKNRLGSLPIDHPLSLKRAANATSGEIETSQFDLAKNLKLIGDKDLNDWFEILESSMKSSDIKTQWEMKATWVMRFAEETGELKLGEDWLVLAIENYSQILRELFVPVYTELANITGFINEYYLEGKVDSGLQAAESAKRFEKNTKAAMKTMNKQEG